MLKPGSVNAGDIDDVQVITEVVEECQFREKMYTFNANEKRTCSLYINVPVMFSLI